MGMTSTVKLRLLTVFIFLEEPQSASLMLKSFSSGRSTMMFSGLTSRWIILALCASFNADSNWLMIF